jgi:hypothetical protein
MAAFIPIFIIEKVGRRPLMLFGVCHPHLTPNLQSIWPLGENQLTNIQTSGRRHVNLNGRPRRKQLPPHRPG